MGWDKPPAALGSPVYVVPGHWSNLGTLAHLSASMPGPIPSIPVRYIPTWAINGDRTVPLAYTLPCNGRISGQVLITSVPAPGILVRCYYKETGNLVKQTWTDASGNYAFDYLTTADEYYVLAFDDVTQLPNFNAQVFDRIVPEAV